MGQQAKFKFFEYPPIGGSMAIVEPPNLVTPSWNFVTPISKSTKVHMLKFHYHLVRLQLGTK